MSDFIINYIKKPAEDTTNSSRPIKVGATAIEAFWFDNLSMDICMAMILKIDVDEMIRQNTHRAIYGKYIGGFVFEGFAYLPPLCILQVILNGSPNNAVYYHGTVFDPQLGIFNANKYEQKNLNIISYIQIFLHEAYDDFPWKPIIPNEIEVELQKDSSLMNIWNQLSSMEQSKILNYIYPFSKPSSINESRTKLMPLKTKQVESIVSHIKSMKKPESFKSCWEELHDFETVEAVDILKKCGLEEGMTVLDMGCGRGHYTIPASITAGIHGSVIAVDRNKKVIKEAKSRINSNNYYNVIFMNTDEKGLAEYINKIDFIILYDVFNLWAMIKQPR